MKRQSFPIFALVLLLLTSTLYLPTLASAENALDPAPQLQPVGTDNGKKILFDNTHGQTAGAADWVLDGGFSDFANALANKGYYAKELRKTTPITYQDLQGYNVLVIGEANIPYKTSEQAAMIQYVQNGGSIFFIGDHYNADRNKNRWDASEVFNGYRRGAYANPTKGMTSEEASSAAMQGVTGSDWLSANFGIRFRYNAIGDVTANDIVTPSQAFGITTGVSTVAMHAGATLAITDPAKAKGIVYLPKTTLAWGNAVDQGVYNGGGRAEGPYAAVSKLGLGKAAFIGDSSAVEDATPKYLREETGAKKTTYDGFKEQNDGTLLVNIIDWLAKQESYTSLTQVSGLQLDQPTALLSMENPQTSTEPQVEPWAAPDPGYKWYDSSTFKSGSYGYGSSGSSGTTTTLNEKFESGSKTAYTSGNVTLSSGSWYFDNALIGNLSTDKKTGLQSARVRAAGALTMNFNVSGAKSIQISHANFGTDSGANWQLQLSTNSGSTWTNVGSTNTSSSTLTVKTFTLTQTAPVRFRMVVSGTSGSRINFDDIVINN
ncbi:Ig domain protein group 2 domain protein [Neobacillus drentensis]|uniref:Ig domain protein group 2 domain protein n=1 Tax=Neobacillus drentensis TaxID=220684 RepID=UPI001F3A654B|nr:Ig domain protein group 2 domain protein [Neobacillus drentensis]ULT59324.1 Ig domain protein group 2 domain protein [Neobacillus drentensis]